MSEQYKYLRNNANSSSSTGTDVNDVVIHYHDADTDFVSESFGAGKSTRILHIDISNDSLAGTGGSLVCEFSDDGINWNTLLDDSDSSVEFTINSSFTGDYITINNPPYPHYRFSYTAGSVTDGTLSLRVMYN